MIKDKRKILRALDMEDYFKANSYNPYIEEGLVDYYRKVPDRPEIKRIPIPVDLLNLQDQQQSVGIIKVDTTPTNADFFILNKEGNEIPFGTTSPSLTVTDVDVGTYNYIIKKEGYDNYNGQITVLDGQICCVQVDLQSAQKSEVCQQIQPTPTQPTPTPSGFFISDRQLLTSLGILFAGIIIGYFISRIGKRD